MLKDADRVVQAGLMNLRLLTSLLPVLAAVQATADGDPPGLAEYCERVLCRVPDVQLRVDAQHGFEQRGGAPMPVLLPNGWLTVYGGETIYVEARVDGAKLTLRPVARPEKPEATLELKFEQLPGKPDMMLTVSNPLPVAVRFRMGFMRPDSDRLLRTSSCPVLAGKKLFEHWPHAIYQLVLADAQVLADGEDVSCK